MKKVYALSIRKDDELEQAIHDMDAHHLRIALYGIARGFQFDEAFLIAEDSAQETRRRLLVCDEYCACRNNNFSAGPAGITCGTCGKPPHP